MPKVGVCSWSLQPASPGELAARVTETGVNGVQLALDPIRSGKWGVDATRDALAKAGVEILSGMMAMEGEDYSTLDSIKATGGVRPDHAWEKNLAAAKANAKIAQQLGIKLVTFHAGFIPHEHKDPERARIIDRVRQIAGAFRECKVDVALETGQESAETLLEALVAIGQGVVGVNFDPANMLLYGMGEPVSALRKLASHVRQVHVKDARPSAVKGSWGTEFPAGAGGVNWPAFFRVALTIRPGVAFVIEREGGDSRVADVKTARQLIASHVP